jgi:hypothetical protein
MAQRLAELDFTRGFAAAGIAYSELDEDWNVVRRTPPAAQEAPGCSPQRG